MSEYKLLFDHGAGIVKLQRNFVDFSCNLKRGEQQPENNINTEIQ